MRNSSRLFDWIGAAAAAFQWLTRFPVPLQVPFSSDLCRRSVIFYPLVGGAVGLFVAISCAAAAWLLPDAPAGVVVALLWAAITGALHLDGLMDTADGLLSGRSRERMLEIMKDSRVGAMGVVVAVAVLLLKASLLVALAEQWRNGHALSIAAALCAIPVWSRWFMVWAIAYWPYAREGEGMGRYFSGVGRLEVLLSTFTAVIVSAGIGFWAAGIGGWGAAQGIWLFLSAFFLLSITIGFLLGSMIARKLGGLTGDTYGALNELLETVLLLIFVMVLHQAA
ncbi:adenosylcobinamide-GDP ribazoletransferase [Paenibacillus turpanensis]|uniref:adenosylcobinamide-GDP ribazoletransferase n=1 Tax=Paenibacillus turpanensis TaxID=2689078 RepID=UPI00140E9554|nr:adenosylcobinamide-GDP ribazoletransferase [Paenibacillus turpanensis]